MRLVLDNLKIELESQQEIQDFWNVIMFALDLHNERSAKNEGCMTERELELAKSLADITKKAWEN